MSGLVLGIEFSVLVILCSSLDFLSLRVGADEWKIPTDLLCKSV